MNQVRRPQLPSSVRQEINYSMETCPVSGASVEILLLSIPASKRIEDVSSTAGQTWSTLISAYKNMPGTQDIYWGRKIEDPGTVLLIIGTQTPCLSSVSFHEQLY